MYMTVPVGLFEGGGGGWLGQNSYLSDVGLLNKGSLMIFGLVASWQNGLFSEMKSPHKSNLMLVTCLCHSEYTIGYNSNYTGMIRNRLTIIIIIMSLLRSHS